MDNQIRLELQRLYKFGMVMFALQAVYTSLAFYHAYQLEKQFVAAGGLNQHSLIDGARLSFFFVFIILPMILIFVTYYKIYVPGKKMGTSNKEKSWNLSLAFLGFVFGLIVGGVIFAHAYNKIRTRFECNPSSRTDALLS